MSNGLPARLHTLEEEFGLSAVQILDTINNRNRCKIAVRGAIAEAHLIRELTRLKTAGSIDGFEDFDQDGHPDCRVDVNGKSFLVECKNVQRGTRGPITIDFWRTRAPIGRPWERYYATDEFQVVAACLWNRTGNWEFRYAATVELPRHPSFTDRLTNKQTVEPSAPGLWTPDLIGLLSRL